MTDFIWTPEEIQDSEIMEDMYKVGKWSEKHPVLDFLAFMIFAPIFKIIEEITFTINSKGFK